MKFIHQQYMQIERVRVEASKIPGVAPVGKDTLDMYLSASTAEELIALLQSRVRTLAELPPAEQAHSAISIRLYGEVQVR